MTIYIAPARALSQNLLFRSHHLLLRASLSTSPILRVSQHYSTKPESSALSLTFPLDSALPLQSRSYATTTPSKPVGRPKAHTGRTPAKRTATKRKPTARSASTTKTPRRGITNAKKPAAKPRKKKVVSKTAQKKLENKKAKDLKEQALLNAPKRLPSTAWTVIFTENAVKGAPISGNSAKSAAQKYRNLSLEELERLNHTANENRAKNDATYKRWLSTFSPLQVKAANTARSQLRRQAKKDGKKKTYPRIQDERLVKQPRNAYSFFLSARVASGDLNNMKVSEVGGLVGREWKSLSASDKKTYDDMAVKDKSRYLEEFKTVYGVDAPVAKK